MHHQMSLVVAALVVAGADLSQAQEALQKKTAVHNDPTFIDAEIAAFSPVKAKIDEALAIARSIENAVATPDQPAPKAPKDTEAPAKPKTPRVKKPKVEEPK